MVSPLLEAGFGSRDLACFFSALLGGVGGLLGAIAGGQLPAAAGLERAPTSFALDPLVASASAGSAGSGPLVSGWGSGGAGGGDNATATASPGPAGLERSLSRGSSFGDQGRQSSFLAGGGALSQASVKFDAAWRRYVFVVGCFAVTLAERLEANDAEGGAGGGGGCASTGAAGPSSPYDEASLASPPPHARSASQSSLLSAASSAAYSEGRPSAEAPGSSPGWQAPASAGAAGLAGLQPRSGRGESWRSESWR